MFGFPTATLLDCHGRYAQNVAFFSESAGDWDVFSTQILRVHVLSTGPQSEEAEETFL